MTLLEAIEIQEQYLRQPQTHLADYLDDAIKLGVEALKELKRCRVEGYRFVAVRLPGETEGRIIQRQGNDIRGNYSYEEFKK